MENPSNTPTSFILGSRKISGKVLHNNQRNKCLLFILKTPYAKNVKNKDNKSEYSSFFWQTVLIKDSYPTKTCRFFTITKTYFLFHHSKKKMSKNINFTCSFQ